MTTTDVDERPREQRLADYNELREGLQDMLAMMDDSDEEMKVLVADAKAQVTALAKSLNAEEHIGVTPGLVKALLPDNLNEGRPVIFYPPSETPQCSAPYEVLYDERAYYACVVTDVIPPQDPMDRLRYTVWILGYHVTETVHAEALRPWRPSNAAQLHRGAPCHVIHPRTALFVPAVVERLTLDGTVIVRLKSDPASPAVECAAEDDKDVIGSSEATCEVPLTHVRVGPHYAQLRKRPQLSEAERAARRLENSRKRRERHAAEKEQKANMIEQDANDWKALMGDLMGEPVNKRRRV